MNQTKDKDYKNQELLKKETWTNLDKIHFVYETYPGLNRGRIHYLASI